MHIRVFICIYTHMCTHTYYTHTPVRDLFALQVTPLSSGYSHIFFEALRE